MVQRERLRARAFGALVFFLPNRRASNERRRLSDKSRRVLKPRFVFVPNDAFVRLFVYAQTLRCPSAAISSTLSVSTSPVAYKTFAVRARWFRDTTSALYHIPSSGQYNWRFGGSST